MKSKKKKVEPVVVEYPKVYVKCDLAWTEGGGDITPGEKWSDRETEYRHYEVEDYFLLSRPKGVFGFDSVEVPDWKEGTDTIYAVVVSYSTGDTFGRCEGCLAIPIAFVDVKEANAIAKQIDQESKQGVDGDRFQDPTYGFYKSWTGYFEHKNGVEVKKLTLEGTGLYRSKK